MRTYQGAVFYVDVLGFSALTKGVLKEITEADNAVWGLNGKKQGDRFLFQIKWNT